MELAGEGYFSHVLEDRIDLPHMNINSSYTEGEQVNKKMTQVQFPLCNHYKRSDSQES